MTLDVESLLKDLTLEEKASLCSGQDFWTTKAVERLGIPSWMMTDGPHGLRKQPNSADGGVLNSIPATCFPAGVGLASSWNVDLIGQVGTALAREAKAERVGVLLGPAINIKRSPLCGRNFEYFSEDPYQAGQMARAYIDGVQSQGIGTSLKHFAANNQEKLRMVIDTLVDERTLREIYLAAFETAVKGAQPWTVMGSYNRINGTYASENPWLLTKVLKEEWGHTGFVVTDWGACNDRVEGLAAGQDLEMPGGNLLNDARIVEAVKSGRLPVEALDKAVRRLLTITAKVLENLDPTATFDRAAHHALARKAGTQTMVLLKNEGGLLPLKGGKIAFLGAFAASPRYQGGGSSHIQPTQMDSAVDEARKLAPLGSQITYGAGYDLASADPVPALVAEARTLASEAAVAVVFVGLTDAFESEGFDRTHLALPEAHRALVDAVRSVQPNTVVVLSNGSPVEMPWAPSVPAILESYLGGQAWGGAVADLLFGRANPSAKLAETFPHRLEDTPCYLNFPGDGTRVEYREGVFVGYRHYEAVRQPVLFPFGHGLSYTTFAYSNLRMAQPSVTEGQTLEVTVDVTNLGNRAGAEVVQLYVVNAPASVLRPKRELKGFAKLELAPGETKTATFTLDDRSWAWYSVAEQRWVVEAGRYGLAVGASSADTRLETTVEVRSTRALTVVCDANTTLGSQVNHPTAGPAVQALLNQMIQAFTGGSTDSVQGAMVQAMLRELPVRNLVTFSGGKFTPQALETLIAVLNGQADPELLTPRRG